MDCRNKVKIISNGGFLVTVFLKCQKGDFHCRKTEIASFAAAFGTEAKMKQPSTAAA